MTELSHILGSDEEPDLYLLVEVSGTSPLVSGDTPLVTSIWKKSQIDDYWYRVDSADPQKKVRRHIAIAKGKHRNAKNKQVSWNDDGTRHDKKSFDDNFKGIEKAKKIARGILKLPDETVLQARVLFVPEIGELKTRDGRLPMVGFSLEDTENA